MAGSLGEENDGWSVVCGTGRGGWRWIERTVSRRRFAFRTMRLLAARWSDPTKRRAPSSCGISFWRSRGATKRSAPGRCSTLGAATPTGLRQLRETRFGVSANLPWRRRGAFWQEGDLAGMPHTDGIARRFDDFVQGHAEAPGCQVLLRGERTLAPRREDGRDGAHLSPVRGDPGA